MPSTNQSASGRTRETFPKIRDDVGEDPARWLDWSILGDKSREKLVRTRIDSIDSIEMIRAWIGVERALERGDDGGPREAVINALEQRERRLNEIGERPERLQQRDNPRDLAPVECSYPDRDDIDEASDRSTYSSTRIFGPLRERYPHLFEDGPSADESDQTGAVATDGGSDE
ncbi:hypothetical protein IL252_15725 [Halomicrobium sp. IBSBa]|uniref:hypothetical protein n=1 Tax=Halomicrobium sp. IBSBa TaxID=2778916 RepID=UPI001ABF7DA2|nr:hypothetical protein [Halomicrobium sp. IBSBa]MBO4249265.1 hypothetical protein [Halomicrobium sp. IBSBa]